MGTEAGSCDSDVGKIRDQWLVVRRTPKQVLVRLEVTRHIPGLDRRIRVAEKAPAHLVLQLRRGFGAVLRIVTHQAVKRRVAAGHLRGVRDILVFGNDGDQQEERYQGHCNHQKLRQRLTLQSHSARHATGKAGRGIKGCHGVTAPCEAWAAARTPAGTSIKWVCQ